MQLQAYPFDDTPPRIRELFNNQGRVETSWPWFTNLVHTTLTSDEIPIILALQDADGPVAALPLATKNKSVFRGLTSPYTTCFSPPLGNEHQAFSLGQLLGHEIKGYLELDAMDVPTHLGKSFSRGLRKAGLFTTTYGHFGNWFEVIQDFSPYWINRSSKLKATVRRKSKKLFDTNRLRFQFIDIANGAEVGCAIYESVYDKSWKPREPHPAFIGGLLLALGRVGLARLAVAQIDGVPAAVQIWLQRGHASTIFKLAQDPRFDDHSPGTLLTYWVLQELCEKHGVTEVDFGRGDDEYKKSWVCNRRVRYGLIAANPRTLVGLQHTISRIAPTALSNLRRRQRSHLERLADEPRRSAHHHGEVRIGALDRIPQVGLVP